MAQDMYAGLESMVASPLVPKIYANGIFVANTMSDITIALFQGRTGCGIVTMSFPTAKMLLSNLEACIKNYEKTTDQEVPDIQTLLDKVANYEKEHINETTE
jgi:hypothetical protein